MVGAVRGDGARLDQVARPDPAEVAASLRAVLTAVDAGAMEADGAQRAYLAGAADALDGLAGRVTDRPEPDAVTANDRLP